MRPSRVQLICRSHNCFSPSIALWQHFVVAPGPVRLSRRLLSSAPPRTDDDAPLEQPLFRKLYLEDDQRLELSRLASVPRPFPSVPYPTRSLAPEVTPEQAEALHAKTRGRGSRPRPVAVAPYQLPSTITPIEDKNLPWFLPNRVDNSVKAKQEIGPFCSYVRPSESEALVRQHIIDLVSEHVRRVLPDVELELFGSERTGLAAALSDIDLRLVTADVANDQLGAPVPTWAKRRDNLHNLHKLAVSLRKEEAFLFSEVRYARYPLVEIKHRDSNIAIQLVAANDSSASREKMAAYIREYSFLPRLYTVVKVMFDMRGLSEVFTGGFGSYSLFMMIVAALKHHPPEYPDAARGLVCFVEFWSTFDTTKGLSIEPVETFDKAANPVMPAPLKAELKDDKTKALPGWMLCLRDPADPTNDLGRKGTRITQVQATCARLVETLAVSSSKPRNKMERRQKDKSKEHSILRRIVGPMYELDLEKRLKLESLGAAFEPTEAGALKQRISAREREQSALGMRGKRHAFYTRFLSGLKEKKAHNKQVKSDASPTSEDTDTVNASPTSEVPVAVKRNTKHDQLSHLAALAQEIRADFTKLPETKPRSAPGDDANNLSEQSDNSSQNPL